MPLLSNTYAGNCGACGTHVAASQGHVARTHQRGAGARAWRVLCPACADPQEQWLCVCRFPGGAVETTAWVTQDGAAEMADETEQQGRRDGQQVRCQVLPVAGRTS